MPEHSSRKTSRFCIKTKCLPTQNFQHMHIWPKKYIPLLEHSWHSPDLAPYDSSRNETVPFKQSRFAKHSERSDGNVVLKGFSGKDNISAEMAGIRAYVGPWSWNVVSSSEERTRAVKSFTALDPAFGSLKISDVQFISFLWHSLYKL
jgi:hypothetical protein